MKYFKAEVRPQSNDPLARGMLLADWARAIEEDTAMHEHARYLQCIAPNSDATTCDIMEFRVEHIIKRAEHKLPTRSSDVTLLNIIHTILDRTVLDTLVNAGAFIVPSDLGGRYGIHED